MRHKCGRDGSGSVKGPLTAREDSGHPMVDGPATGFWLDPTVLGGQARVSGDDLEPPLSLQFTICDFVPKIEGVCWRDWVSPATQELE